MEVAKNMDSVFDAASNDDLDFDIMFDQDDNLIDLVNGLNEAGDPLTGVDFEDLHQTQDDADADDVRDVQSDDELMGAKNIEGTKGFDPDDNSYSQADFNKDSEADKFEADSDKHYQNCDNCGPKPDVDSVEDTIEKAVESTIVTLEDIEAEIDEEERNKDITLEDIEAELFYDEDVNIDSQDIMGEIDKEKDIEEAADDSYGEDDEDEDLIDAVMGGEPESTGNYDYDISDEELIDDVMND